VKDKLDDYNNIFPSNLLNNFKLAPIQFLNQKNKLNLSKPKTTKRILENISHINMYIIY